MLGPPYRPAIYPANHFFYPNPRAVTYPPLVLDVNWFETWPTIRTILIGGVMLLTSAAIVGMDIANVAIEGNKTGGLKLLGVGTAKVGAGIWSGSISFLAALFIAAIVFVKNKRLAAGFALITVTLAFFFSIVLVGLTANAIQINPYYAGSQLQTNQYNLIIAILSLAAFNVTLCLAFFIVYIRVFFVSSTRHRPVKY